MLRPSRTVWRAIGLAGLGAALTAGVALPAVAVPSAPASSSSASSSSASDGERPADGLVLVGVAGLLWGDVDRTTTPTLWRLVGEGSVGSISTRTSTGTTCPLDGWLTISAGTSTLAARPDDLTTPTDPAAPDDDEAAAAEDVSCPAPPTVVPDDDGALPAAGVQRWAELVARPAGAVEAPVAGLLGDAVQAAGTCAVAVGPGGAVALADATGRVGRYAAVPADVLAGGALDECPLVVVDAGQLDATGSERVARLGELDDLLADVVTALPDGRRLVVAGIADTAVRQHELQVAVDWTAGDPTNGWLTSASTRRVGQVTLADLTATAVQQVGGDVSELDGSPLESEPGRRLSTERTVENRRYLTQVSRTVAVALPVLVSVTLLAALVAVGALVVGGRRRSSSSGPEPSAAVPPGASPAVRRAALATLTLACSLPAGAYLAALTRWWATPAPLVVAVASAVVGAGLVAALGVLVARRLPPGPWSLAAAPAGLTWLVLTVDGLTGTVLQQGTVLSWTAALGARYYGFGNTTFAVYGVSALVLAGAVAALTAGRSRRVRIALVVAIGVVTVVVDGWPAFGADFGGILSLVPAFALLVLGLAGVALTARRVLAALAAGVATVAVVAVLDWLAPGPGSHLGGFVTQVLDGRAAETVARKAAAAWGTLWNPLGGPAAVVCVVGALALVGPRRWRPAAVTEAYAQVPGLRPVAAAAVTLATAGTLLNDSGVSVAAIVLTLGTALVATSLAAHRAGWPAPAGALPNAASSAGFGDGGVANHAGSVTEPGWSGEVGGGGDRDAPARRPVAVLAGVGGGLLTVVVLVASLVPTSPTHAGDVARHLGAPLIGADAPTVVVGVPGLRWQDVTAAGTPTLWRMLGDGAAVAGVTPAAGGVNGSCEAAGWLGISSGRAPVTGETLDVAPGTTTGTTTASPTGRQWTCYPWTVAATGAGSSADAAASTDEDARGGASVVGWQTFVDAQQTSAFRPQLGTLGDALAEAGVCTTAVGPGAALALADGDGEVARYRTVAAALADPDEAFGCPLTVVDIGSVTYDPAALAASELAVADRQAALTAADALVRRVLAAAPDDATVLVVGTGNPARTNPWLGVALVRAADAPAQRFVTSASTHWQGAVRLLDVPTSLADALTGAVPADLTGGPLVVGGARDSDAATVVGELSSLTARDRVLRSVSSLSTMVPTLLGLALLAAALWLPGVRRARSRWRWPVDTVALVLGALPAALFVVSAWQWWRFDASGEALAVAAALGVAGCAGVAALVPRRPVWAAPGWLAGTAFVVLTLDALAGTPLHRGSPLGPAVTSGGRYYGFGNPTYSVYVVAALVLAAAVGQWLVRRGRRAWAVAATAAIGLVALAVDLLPTLGADVGGGLVLVPAAGVIVLAAAGVGVTWRRLLAFGAAGVGVVALAGFVDWLRPPDDRTHLGAFVQQVVDGEAWQTVARKAGYALNTLTSGPMAWLTLVVLVATAVVVWRAGRGHVGRLTEVEAAWPMARPLLVALLVAAVGGAALNDYGLRIVTVMLAAAVPLAVLVVVRTPDPGRTPLPCDQVEQHAPREGAPPQEER